MSDRYKHSEEMLQRALKTIPLGTQTFSKSQTQYPREVSPYYLKRGLGSHVWDIDGNEYVDFIMSLCAVTLGYSDPDITAAVRSQLEDGVIFSLPHPIEVEAAERVVEMVPCAEMVRFGKNGSDATAGAVRVSRAFTGRDHVLTHGYHGWQDWSIGSTARNAGVPKATQSLTHVFPYNDLDALKSLFDANRGEVACLIMEPMNVVEPNPGYLNEVAEMCRANGTVFVLDETITGFRYANGGAQEYFDVTPDLATFGKGLANGYPVSAIAGRADIMKLMEEVFFSFTFGGEALSLAAAVATMDKLRREPVVATIAESGRRVIDETRRLIEANGCGDFLSVSGHPAWSFLLMKDYGKATSWDLKTVFEQELFARGILAYGTHNMCYTHGDAEIRALLDAYAAVFPILRTATTEGACSVLRCEPLKPLFKVR